MVKIPVLGFGKTLNAVFVVYASSVETVQYADCCKNNGSEPDSKGEELGVGAVVKLIGVLLVKPIE